MSRDGQVIVAAIQNNYQGRRSSRSSPASPRRSPTRGIPFATQLRGFDLSADGSTLLLQLADAGLRVRRRDAHDDVPDRARRPRSTATRSGDGRVVRHVRHRRALREGRDRLVAHTYTRTVPGTCVCSRIDPEDGSDARVRLQFLRHEPARPHRSARRRATKQVTTSDDAYGTGIAPERRVRRLDVSCRRQPLLRSASGATRATCPELRFYRSTATAPWRSSTCRPRSSTPTSADGARVAVASKAVHVNTFCFLAARSRCTRSRAVDLRAQGIPVVGGRVAFHLVGPVNSPRSCCGRTRPLSSRPTSATSERSTCGARALYAVPMGATNGGQAAVEFPPRAGERRRPHALVPGFTSSPLWRLTRDSITLTILP